MDIMRDTNMEASIRSSMREAMDRRGGGRTPGPHLSTLVSYIAARMQLIRVTGGADSDAMMERMLMGYVWEDMVGQQLNHIISPHIGQFEILQDGIFATPDAYTPGGEIGEFKATWISNSNDITGERFWRYWAQIKAYCRMTGTNTARLYVMFVNSDYKPPAPGIAVYRARFSNEELDANWKLMTGQMQQLVTAFGDNWWKYDIQYLLRGGSQHDQQ